MAGVSIDIRYEDSSVRLSLTRLRQRVGRMAPAYKVIGEELTNSTIDRFSRQVDPEGHPWQPLQPATLAAKAARGMSPKILRARGYLADSIHPQADEQGVRIGTARIYAAIQQLGGKTRAHVIRARTKKALAWPGAAHPVRQVNHPGSKIPPRRFLGVSLQDRDAILEIVEDYLEGSP
ncbi:phage virion morphogenesis protein [Desulfobulbus elongatus]|uniref:phage virion morphogenesis protein n=1 Tax=Desulfobulbus elongatus TaxID=53332 RepID=UPI000688206D|nr:phage virion morphogenesis protein [Desulfobulbus elongatus]